MSIKTLLCGCVVSGNDVAPCGEHVERFQAAKTLAATVEKWYAGLAVDVHSVRVSPHDLFLTGELCATEKEAIAAKRKLHITRMEDDRRIVNALDERFDAIEDEEMAKGNA